MQDQQEYINQQPLNYSSLSHINAENQANILSIRLDTENTLQKIELDLKGLKIEQNYDDKGNVTVAIVKEGKPLANPEGIHQLMIHLRGIFDPQVVQGNLEGVDQYHELVRQHHLNLNDKCFFFSEELGLDLKAYHSIMTMIPPKTEAFLSRLLKNKERESYGNIEFRESRIETPQKRNILGLKSG